MIGDLEVIPRKAIEYRGATFEEMDLDAILARKPEVALVDELAHTNVPGSQHEKRWQDVDDLLEAGITVISTLNIQHLESVNDVVEQITGVKQRETIPDEVVRRADQIELVDMAPEAMRRRMAHGNIYPAERIDAALGNYFRPGNLGALRELALLWVADRVDEALHDYRERHGIDQPWETRERVVVAVTGAPGGDRLIRRGARMAARTKGDLVAVHVRSQDGLAGPSAVMLEEQRVLVDELGGTYREVVGADVGEALVDTARSLNATQIVLGATRRSRWAELTRGSVINRIIRDAGLGIDVHVISRGDEAGEGLPRAARPAALSRRRQVVGFALALLAPAVLAVVLANLRENLGLPSVLLLFLLLVVGVSAVGGLWPALVAAVAGFLLVNWYFTPPLYTFTISEGENVLALVVFLAVALVVSGFVALAARRAAAGARARAEAEALARLAGSSPVPALLDSLRRVFGLDAVSLLHSDGGAWRIEASSGAPAPGSPEEATTTVSVGDRHVLALSGGTGVGEDERILDAFVAEIAAALELEELETEASEAGSLAAANDLRTAILSAVSHDLRTPLAAIKASVTSLLQDDVDWTPEARHEFLDTIDEETDRLNDLVGNLLDMSRLQTGALATRLAPVGRGRGRPGGAREPRRQRGSGRRARRRDASARARRRRPARARARQRDRERAGRLAARRSTSSSTPAWPTGASTFASSIAGRASRRATASEMFRPFQRLGDSGNGDGVGLGLAVAKGFVEAMDGEVEVEDTPGGGLTMVFRLRMAE